MNHDPLHPHSHESNPHPPSQDTSIVWSGAGVRTELTVDELRRLPSTSLMDCYIVSTGHGTSGPFTFSGPPIRAVVESQLGEIACSGWHLEVISADEFGTRIDAEEIMKQNIARPVILALSLNNRSLTRSEGLVRLIVPSETDDALRQVKWVARISFIGTEFVT